MRANTSESIIVSDRSRGSFVVVKPYLADKFRRISPCRAGFAARGIITQEAAVRFFDGCLKVQWFAHWLKLIDFVRADWLFHLLTWFGFRAIVIIQFDRGGHLLNSHLFDKEYNKYTQNPFRTDGYK